MFIYFKIISYFENIKISWEKMRKNTFFDLGGFTEELNKCYLKGFHRRAEYIMLPKGGFTEELNTCYLKGVSQKS